MKRLFFCLFLMAVGRVFAQPGIQWQKCLGGSKYEQATAIHQTSDGGSLLVGYTRSVNGDVTTNMGLYDFWVVKMDELGSIQWQKTLGGSQFDWAHGAKQTDDGGYIIVGYTSSNDGAVSGNHGNKDGWVVKLDSIGGLEWQKALGGTGWEEFYSVELTSDGGYLIAGMSDSSDGDVTENFGYTDFWIVKMDISGTVEWQKSLGGSNEDRALKIKMTADGGYIVVGETKSNDGDVSGNNGNIDFWVVKLSQLGVIEWQNSLGGSGWDAAYDVVETLDAFVVCGFSGSFNNGDVTGNHGSFDSWVVKLSKNGLLIWEKSLGGTNADYARSIIQTCDGMFIVAGEAKSNNVDVTGNNGIQVAWVIKLNDEGDLIWQKALGGTDGEGCNSIQQTSDGGYVLAGYAWSNNGDVSGNHGEADYWVVKLAQESTPTTQPTTHSLNLYPNPATQSITIQIPDIESTLSIQITDLLGCELGRQTIPNGGTVDIESLPNGLYLVSASTDSGEVFLGRVCKQE